MTILFDNYNLNALAGKIAGEKDRAASSPVSQPDVLSGTHQGPAEDSSLPQSDQRPGDGSSTEPDCPTATSILEANKPALDDGSRTRRPFGILVVDDEQLIREVLNRFLHLAGFRVFLAANGHEAVELYRNEAAGIDAVLLDVRMPGVDGPATLAALRCLDPHVRCCFMSGDLGFHSPEDLFRLGALALFEKPLNLGELADALRRVIGSPAKT